MSTSTDLRLRTPSRIRSVSHGSVAAPDRKRQLRPRISSFGIAGQLAKGLVGDLQRIVRFAGLLSTVAMGLNPTVSIRRSSSTEASTGSSALPLLTEHYTAATVARALQSSSGRPAAANQGEADFVENCPRQADSTKAEFSFHFRILPANRPWSGLSTVARMSQFAGDARSAFA
jgi:hypothetical protein